MVETLQMFSSMLRATVNLVVKGNKCQIIQTDASNYKGLKSEMINNKKLVCRFCGPGNLRQCTQCILFDRESLNNYQLSQWYSTGQM